MFGDNGLGDAPSWLYFPADAAQMHAIVQRVFFDHGIRFIFSTRSKLPYILKEDGKSRHFDDEYNSERMALLSMTPAGYVGSFGAMLHRSWDAILRLRQEGLGVGFIN